MNISYNWLKKYVDFNLTPDELAAALTSLGLETGSVEKVETIKGGLAGLVVGEVLTCVEHPDSDHLHITTVDLGDGVPTQIVCGAPNVAAGQHVVVATVGTKLKGTDKEFYYFNTHLDHIGREARKNSILLIVDKIAEINTQGLPVFLSADFNSPTDNAIFDPLKQALGDARTDCTVTDKSITYNGFGQVEGNPATNNDNEQVIDHIFYKGVRPGTFKVLNGDYEVPYISDHYPIAFTFRFAQ